MGVPVNDVNAQSLAQPEGWGFAPPTWKGLTAAHMILAAERGEIDTLWQTGGNFVGTLPETQRVIQAGGKIKLPIHPEICVNSQILIVTPDTTPLLPPPPPH